MKSIFVFAVLSLLVCPSKSYAFNPNIRDDSPAPRHERPPPPPPPPPVDSKTGDTLAPLGVQSSDEAATNELPSLASYVLQLRALNWRLQKADEEFRKLLMPAKKINLAANSQVSTLADSDLDQIIEVLSSTSEEDHRPALTQILVKDVELQKQSRFELLALGMGGSSLVRDLSKFYLSTKIRVSDPRHRYVKVSVADHWQRNDNGRVSGLPDRPGAATGEWSVPNFANALEIAPMPEMSGDLEDVVSLQREVLRRAKMGAKINAQISEGAAFYNAAERLQYQAKAVITLEAAGATSFARTGQGAALVPIFVPQSALGTFNETQAQKYRDTVRDSLAKPHERGKSCFDLEPVSFALKSGTAAAELTARTQAVLEGFANHTDSLVDYLKLVAEQKDVNAPTPQVTNARLDPAEVRNALNANNLLVVEFMRQQLAPEIKKHRDLLVRMHDYSEGLLARLEEKSVEMPNLDVKASPLDHELAVQLSDRVMLRVYKLRSEGRKELDAQNIEAQLRSYLAIE